jgi:hypothetical protein
MNRVKLSYMLRALLSKQSYLDHEHIDIRFFQLNLEVQIRLMQQPKNEH